MRKCKIFVSTCLALSMVLLVGDMISAKSNNIKAVGSIVQKSNNIQNHSKRLTFDEAEMLFEDIKTKVENKYQGVYSFDYFQASFVDVESKNEFVDVDVTVHMTLVRNPKETPYVQGMIKALNALQNPVEKAIAQRELDSYLEEVMPYYNVPDITTFSYRVKVPTVVALKEDSSNYEIFYRTDITDEIVDLVKVPENEVLQEIGTKEDGEQEIARALTERLELEKSN